MIKTIMIGDQVLWGALGTRQLTVTPQQTLNANQSVFDFCYNYQRPGSSWAGCFSDDPSVRLANGLPGGKTLAETLDLHTDAGAVLFSLGGNDGGQSPNEITLLASRIKQAAKLCVSKNKLFAFLGVIDINVTSQYNHTPIGANIYESGYLQRAAAVAGTAETIRQVCLHEGYPFIDIRKTVPISDWSTITGDIVHPSQQYSTQIFTTVAKAISGQQP